MPGIDYAEYGRDLDQVITHLSAHGADGHTRAGELLAGLIDRIARGLYVTQVDNVPEASASETDPAS